MGQLVFQATLGGQVNLVGPNTASTFNINVPAVAGNMVTTGDTGTVTNTMLAGSIANAKLTNSSVTIGSTSVALGATAATVAGLTLTTPVINGFTGDTSVINVGSGQFYKDASGNVGIGTSSPAEKIAVTNTALTSTTVLANTVAAFRSNASGADANIKLSDGVTYSANIGQNSGNIYFAPNGTEKMRIDTSGNLLVGATSATGKLGVNGDGSQRIANFKNTAGTDATLFGIYVAKFQNDSSTSQRYIGFSYNNDGNGGGQINGNGASQAAFGSFSDIRLKENIVDLPPQLEKVLALRPVEFDYKTGGHQTGFIAQEMQQVFPDAVGDDGSEDHYLTVTGWNKTEAIFVKAIQEQQAMITSQSELITTLTERITALEQA